MLDPRLHRAALLPFLLALVVCAFSLENRPGSIRTTLPPDAFDAGGAMRVLEDLGDRFPDRRPGSAGDEALATEVAGRLRALGVYAVRGERFRAPTIDGRRQLVDVIARRAGAAGPGLVVVAHRDAAARGSRAELSGTAALLELARVASEAPLERTITFVSTSGGSGGAAGARALAEQLGEDPSAVLVLGDMAGQRVRKPFVMPWGDGAGRAPLRLERTVEVAIRAEARTGPGGSRASAQLARLALPGTVGEQGPLVSAGLPAVLLSVSGERPPRPGERVLEPRMAAFGRAALRSVLALDAGPVIAGGPVHDVVTLRKVLPGWALRLLVAALLLPALIAAVDAMARANRRGEPVGAALVWVLRAALPLLAALAAARVLGLVGWLPFPPSPLPAPGLSAGARELAAIAVVVLVAALVLLLVRPHGPLRGPGAGAAVAGVIALVAAVTWVRSPAAALLLAVPAHLWLLLAAAPGLLRRVSALAVVALGVLPVALAIGVRVAQLGVPAEDVPVLWLAIAAGGHLGALSWPAWSLLAACTAAALSLAWRIPSGRARPAPPAARGPAGPGRLTGAASALRR